MIHVYFFGNIIGSVLLGVEGRSVEAAILLAAASIIGALRCIDTTVNKEKS